MDGWYLHSTYSGLMPSFPVMCPWLVVPDPRFPKDIWRPLGTVGLTTLMYGTTMMMVTPPSSARCSISALAVSHAFDCDCDCLGWGLHTDHLNLPSGTKESRESTTQFRVTQLL